jgi:hypothetical protein
MDSKNSDDEYKDRDLSSLLEHMNQVCVNLKDLKNLESAAKAAC